MAAPGCNCPICLARLGATPEAQGALVRFFAVFQRLRPPAPGVEVVEVAANSIDEACEAAKLLHLQRDGLYAQAFKLVQLERGDSAPCRRIWAGQGQFQWVSEIL